MGRFIIISASQMKGRCGTRTLPTHGSGLLGLHMYPLCSTVQLTPMEENYGKKLKEESIILPVIFSLNLMPPSSLIPASSFPLLEGGHGGKIYEQGKAL